jgi:hypothetical protein
MRTRISRTAELYQDSRVVILTAMRSPRLAALALLACPCLALTGCGAGSHSATGANPAPTTSVTTAPTSAAAASCTLPTEPDFIERIRTPRLPESAVLVGSANLARCITTLAGLPAETPTGPGYCTWIALASDNPGYDIAATPAPALKKVIAMYGASCL